MCRRMGMCFLAVSLTALAQTNPRHYEEKPNATLSAGGA
jgi:hypothetical protein